MPAVILLIALGAAAAVASGVWWLAPLASNWGVLDTMFEVTTLVTGIAFIVVHLILAYAVYRFRHRNGQRVLYFDDNPRLERLLIGVTALGIAVLLVPGLFAYAQVIGHPPEDALVVEVLGEQWRWNYRLPGDDGVFGRTDINLVSRENPFGLDLSDPNAADDVVVTGPQPLYLPVNRPVVFKFRSNDVLHNFWVPEFRVKVDAVPGMVTEKWLVPTRTGKFQAACAEYCGIAHYVMVSDLFVVEEAEFANWLAQQPTAGETLK